MRRLGTLIDLLALWWLGAPAARYGGDRYSRSRSRRWESLQSARFDYDHATREDLQAQCRKFEQENPIAQRLVSVFETYTAGNGLVLTPNSSNPEWNARARDYWEAWAAEPEVNTKQSLGALQSLWARRWFTDGECFILKAEDERRQRKLQTIEAHLCKTPPDQRENTSILDGVQLDVRMRDDGTLTGTGRPLGYYIGSETTRGQLTFGAPRSANRVFHLFEAERAGQVRGIPFLASAINEMIDLQDLHDLSMRKAKDGAEITNVILNEAGEIPAALVRKARLQENVEISTGATVSEDKNRFYEDRLGGRTVALERGDKLEQFRDAHPGVATMEYWRYKTELVCIAADIPFVLVFPDSMQGTVYRGALDMATGYFRARSELIKRITQWAFEYVMEGALANKDSGLVDPPADWRRTIISTPRAPNVDVGRNSAAMLAELEAGATNYDLIYGPLGLNWREQLKAKAEQIAYIRQLAEEYGVDAASIAGNAVPEEPAQPARGEEEDAVPIRRRGEERS
jgi:capsid protein